MIRIALVDDQEILRKGLKMILEGQEDIRVVGEAADGAEAYNLCQQHIIDIILMDIKMPNVNGVEATKRIKKDFPNIKIIILTTFNEDQYIFEGLKNGASGYLLKDTSPTKIAEAIREVYRGGVLIQPDIAARVVEQFKTLNRPTIEKDKKIEDLTDREIEIIRLVGEGLNNKEIADHLFITEGTAKNHISNILTKLDLRDRTQLAIYALKNSLV